MTSAQTMRIERRGASRGGARAFLGVLFAALLGGCSLNKTPSRQTLAAPYLDQQLWAVVPPINETGVSVVDTWRVGDMITEELQQVRGIDTLPVNRVLQVMQQQGLESVRTEADVRSLMAQLDVDGLIIGSVTAYDPYPPLRLGLALQLYVRSTESPSQDFDPSTITRITSGDIGPGVSRQFQPVGLAAGIFDAQDQETLAWLHQYAASRSAPESPYGQDIYLVRMDLYTQFVSHRLIRDLLVSERFRLQPMVANQESR